ncbi:hypothetical protein [Aquipuribacter nitratireducens]|uniref:DUF4386 domain-containing protein n=1 Tax=Aquipuribacter nitratireducens TaxID=650104 RepID=A0ABW0GLB1_9MICO
MTVTTPALFRAAAVAAGASGVLFVAVQVAHPHMDATTITTTELVVRNSTKVLMAVLALAGVTGLYLRQVREAGVLGLVGYLLLSAGYLVIGAVAFVAGYVLPAVAGSAPEYVDGVLTIATGGTTSADTGSWPVVNAVQGAGYLLGGLVFGIAQVRARVLARWAAWLLVAATVATLAVPVLPHALDRALAVPAGAALLGLGWSLWRSTRSAAAPVDPAVLVRGGRVAGPR